MNAWKWALASLSIVFVVMGLMSGCSSDDDDDSSSSDDDATDDTNVDDDASDDSVGDDDSTDDTDDDSADDVVDDSMDDTDDDTTTTTTTVPTTSTTTTTTLAHPCGDYDAVFDLTIVEDPGHLVTLSLVISPTDDLSGLFSSTNPSIGEFDLTGQKTSTTAGHLESAPIPTSPYWQAQCTEATTVVTTDFTVVSSVISGTMSLLCGTVEGPNYANFNLAGDLTCGEF